MSRTNTNPISPDYKKNVTLLKKSRSRRDETLNSQEIPANSSSSLNDKVIFQFIVYYNEPSTNKLKGTLNAVDQAMDLLLSRPTNTGENQLITNIKPQISVNTTFTIKKLKFAPEDCCLLKFVWFRPNDLTNKLSILLSVKDFANHAKFVFSSPAWAVYGFAIPTKGSKPYGSESIYYHEPYVLQNVVGVTKIINFILNLFPFPPKAGVPKLVYMCHWGYICLSEEVHLRLSIEGKSMFMHYSFQIIYKYEILWTVACY